MTREEYLAAIKQLGFSQIRAGRELGVSPRHAQRLASGETPIPQPVAKLLRLLVAARVVERP